MTAVIYGSKYGSTKRYAEWIAEELEADVFDVKGFSIDVIEKYDTVIFGGGLYAGGITGLDFIAKNIDRLKNSRLIIFTCGIADPADERNYNNIKTSVFKKLPAAREKDIPLFCLRGELDYGKMSLVHRAMMAALVKSVKGKKEKTDEDRCIIDTYGKRVSFMDRNSIAPIVEYAKQAI